MATNHHFSLLRESSILRSLTKPFRLIKVILIIILILFSSSSVLQICCSKSTLLEQELTISNQISNTTPFLPFLEKSKQKITLNTQITRYTYKALYFLFLEVTQIDRVMSAQSSSDFGFGIKEQIYDYVMKFNNTLKVISIRVGNISLILVYTIYLSFLALIDGLTQRKIRQANASRESATIYHYAKRSRTAIFWGFILLYLSSPIAIATYWMLIPVFFVSCMIYFQAKYLKKYL